MFRIKSLATGAAFGLAAALLGTTALSDARAAEMTNYAPVTQQRLENPEPGNWLLYRRTYDGHGFSPLNQINSTNVKKLVPAWTFATGVNEGHEAPPMVNNGVMFVATPMGQVIALDAKSGDLLWRYKRQLPDDLFQLHPTSRGVALWQDRLYLATTDDFLVALDAKTGKEIWSKKIQEYKRGQYMTLEPLVVDGKVLVGGSGGEFGIRGYVAAFDANDGHELWRTFTIPSPGEPGSDSWPKNDAWKTGGAPVWMTGTYDPKRKLAYWGTGNAAPWPGDARPGDNLYSSSVIALDPQTGKMASYHQYHWNDSWDWDEVDAPMLIKLKGSNEESLVHAGRDGYLWVLKQTDEGIQFVSGKPFVKQNAITGIDANTGRPSYDEAHKPAMSRAQTEFCPSLWGGKDWPAAAYSNEANLLYIPANNNLCQRLTTVKAEYKPGSLFLGVDIAKLDLLVESGADHVGELQAWDVGSGKMVWKHDFKNSQLFGSVLATSGDLVFAGGTNDRFFRAFNAKTGEVLWQQRTQSGIMGMPVAYEVDGTEYVAIQSGWGVDAQRIQDSLFKAKFVQDADVPQGGVVWVFALPKD